MRDELQVFQCKTQVHSVFLSEDFFSKFEGQPRRRDVRLSTSKEPPAFPPPCHPSYIPFSPLSPAPTFCSYPTTLQIPSTASYPISDGPWVSPVHVVPKKAGITVMTNDKRKELQTRLPTKWRVCMDYRKLNAATKKDHFSLPFIDQILDKLSGQ